MAYFTATQADTFYTTMASEPGGWDGHSAAEKLVFLEMASARFDALPWLADYDTEAERTASVPITAAFYEYVRYLSERGGRGSQALGDVVDPEFLNAVADIPSNVAARLIPFLDNEKLSAELATTTVGGVTVNYNPATETPSQAAERYARAEELKARADESAARKREADAEAELSEARTGRILTESEQVRFRTMRPMVTDTRPLRQPVQAPQIVSEDQRRIAFVASLARGTFDAAVYRGGFVTQTGIAPLPSWTGGRVVGLATNRGIARLYADDVDAMGVVTESTVDVLSTFLRQPSTVLINDVAYIEYRTLAASAALSGKRLRIEWAPAPAD